MGGCGGLERTDFNSFTLVGVVVLKDSDFNSLLCVVVLKELIFNSFYIWECVVVLKEVIFNSFYFGGVVVLKELILTVSTLGGCGGLERTDF